MDIRKESQYDKTKSMKREDSIQFKMIQKLKEDTEYKIIFDDDDKDEVSDIVAIKFFDNDYSKIIVDLYHCKFSTEDKAGKRLKDLYEVCGQAQRSFHWEHKVKNLIQHLKHRQNQRINKDWPSRYEIGGEEELQTIKIW